MKAAQRLGKEEMLGEPETNGKQAAGPQRQHMYWGSPMTTIIEQRCQEYEDDGESKTSCGERCPHPAVLTSQIKKASTI